MTVALRFRGPVFNVLLSADRGR